MVLHLISPLLLQRLEDIYLQLETNLSSLDHRQRRPQYRVDLHQYRWILMEVKEARHAQVVKVNPDLLFATIVSVTEFTAIDPIDPILDPQIVLLDRSAHINTRLVPYVAASIKPENGIILGLPNTAVRRFNLDDDLIFRSILSSSMKSKGPISHRSYIFMDTYSLPSFEHTCLDAQRSITVDNAGGKSDISEMYSIDYFAAVHSSFDVILEKEVQMFIDYKMVDFICTIDKHRVGVSVTRAMGFPSPSNFTPAMASKLLYKKLYGLIVARNGVVKSQSFYKSILHIWCQDERIAGLLSDAFANLDANDYGLDVKGVVILQLTVCDDIRIYKNIRPT